MNITDLLGNIKPVSENTMANKIAVKAEIKKIERRAEDIVEQILNFISNETDFINNGLTYGHNSSSIYGCDSTSKHISEEEKKQLLKKLEEVIKQIPNKLKETIDDIFSSSNSDSEEKKAEEQPKDNKEEVKVTVNPVNTDTVSAMFGY